MRERGQRIFEGDKSMIIKGRKEFDELKDMQAQETRYLEKFKVLIGQSKKT